MLLNDFFALGPLDNRLCDNKAQAGLGLLLAAATVTLETLMIKNRQDLILKIEPVYSRRGQRSQPHKT